MLMNRVGEIRYNKGGISRSINEKRNYCGKLEDGSKLVWKRINWKHNKFYKINNVLI